MLNQLKGVFSSLQKHEVKYLVIGGLASILYGVPRATFDLDIIIEATPQNAERLLKALEDANLGTASLTTPEDVLAHEITVFKDYIRIDVQTLTPGISFGEAWQRRETMSHQKQIFYVASKQDIIASKQASGREIDLEDVRLLELGDK